MQSVQNKEEKIRITKKQKQNFARFYLGIGWSNFLQIWYIDLPNWWTSLQQI